jgi:hypothetical protein
LDKKIDDASADKELVLMLLFFAIPSGCAHGILFQKKMKHDANLEWRLGVKRQISVDMTIVNRTEVSKLGDFGA